MNDPHVEALHYSVTHAEDVDYEKAALCRHDTAGFTVRIEADRAEVTMKTHHATVETARAEVEPFLRAWELTAALQLRPGEFEFAYDRAAIIDRNPTPGSTVAIIAEMGLPIDSIGAHVGRSKYPDPPPVGLERDATVEMMFDRFRLYRTGRTTLGDAANYCLTVLEYAAGGRKRAAQRYNVAMTILNTLGGLAGEKGGEEARKARGASKPFTGAERQWLEETMKRLMWRAAEIAGDPNALPQQITMAELPSLSKTIVPRRRWHPNWHRTA